MDIQSGYELALSKALKLR